MFHWLSDDIVMFKIEVGVKEKCTNVTPFPTMFWLRRSSNKYINTQYSFPGKGKI